MTRVFVSYSQDSPEHASRVIALTQELRGDGVDAIVDAFVPAPEQGWARWMANQLAASKFVLVVASEGYWKKAEDKVPKGVGLGVKWESHLSIQEIYEADARNNKYIPILFEGVADHTIPTVLRAWTWYRLPANYEALLRRLHSKPEIVPAALGTRRL